MNMLLKLGTLMYLIKKGFHNLINNATLALTSASTMTICIMLFGVFYAISMNLKTMAYGVESNVIISVFLDSSVNDDRLVEIGNLIRENEIVDSVTYISDEQAWEEYKLEYFDGKEELAESFADDNPLTNAGHYNISMTNIEHQMDLVEYIANIDGVRQINQSQEVAEVFIDLNEVIVTFSIIIITALGIISVFLIQNTISTGITMKKLEISIMKSVGATNFFIQFPFIVEGFIIGAIGSIIPLIVFNRLYNWATESFRMKFTSLENFSNFVPNSDLMATIVPSSLCMGIGIGVFGSIITLYKELSKTT